MSLDIVTDAALAAIPHGFFTRAGGVSKGIYAGLNCGHGSNDDTDHVSENRARVAAALGVAPGHLLTLHQTHSTKVVVATGPLGQPLPKADALVTRTPGLAIGALSADCQPVLFADPGAGVIAAAHAGWKGAFDGVLEATIDTMVAQGARRASILAVIGPAISQQNYEVGQEFLERFMDDDPENGRYFVAGQNGRYQFDLPGFGLGRLRAAGVASASWVGRCTYGAPARFFSWRRACHSGEGDYGRLIGAISLPGPA